jgi:ankyrin repeat protein
MQKWHMLTLATCSRTSAVYATHHRFVSDPPEQPLRSHSLFHIAVAKGDLDAAQVQLDRGVPVDLLAGDGLSAMHWALASRNLTTTSWLLAHGLAIDTRSEEGATALMQAVQDDNVQGAQWLLNDGADANAADNRGFTSLHRAAEMGLESTVRLLLDHGARPDMIAQGHTAAALARGRGHDRIARLLGDGSS